MRHGYYGLTTEIPGRDQKKIFSARNAGTSRIPPFIRQAQPTRPRSHGAILKQS